MARNGATRAAREAIADDPAAAPRRRRALRPDVTDGEGPAKPRRKAKPRAEHPLATWRKAKGMSRTQLQAKLKVATRTTIRRYENGERVPDAAIMKRIVKLTGGAVNESSFARP